MNSYPQAGDIIILDFDPQSGIEIQKKRPALVVSNSSFNQKTGLVMVCPITSTHRNFPLHVTLDINNKTHGDILCEQLKSLDYNARNWSFAEKVSDNIFEHVLFILDKIIGK